MTTFFEKFGKLHKFRSLGLGLFDEVSVLSRNFNQVSISKVTVSTRDGANRKFVPTLRTASAASVRTASAFVVHYSVRTRAAPQSQSFTP